MSLVEEIEKTLARLTPVQQKKVLDFVSSLEHDVEADRDWGELGAKLMAETVTDSAEDWSRLTNK